CRELEVTILCAAIKTNEFPRGMVERGPQIVNSAAYYKGEGGRKLFEKLTGERKLSSIRISLEDKSVRFSSDEGVELPFEVRNVMIGPLKFSSSTFEH